MAMASVPDPTCVPVQAVRSLPAVEEELEVSPAGRQTQTNTYCTVRLFQMKSLKSNRCQRALL